MTTLDPDAAARRRRELREGAVQLMTWGGVMAALCGTCTVSLAGGPVVAVVQQRADAFTEQFLIIQLLIGGLPTVIGLAMLFVGVRRYHRAREP